MSVWVVLLAAGGGDRLGANQPKAFVPLAGHPMVEWSLEVIASVPAVSAVVTVVPAGLVEEAKALADSVPVTVSVIEGGDTRQASVSLGLSAVPSSVDVVICHDAARPLAPPELFDRVIRALDRGDAMAVIPVIPSPDTVKRLDGGMVVETIDRDEVGLAQTPQAFAASALRDAHLHAADRGLVATDDAMLMEARGHRVAVIEGIPSNFKITAPDDLERAERILAARAGASAGESGG